MAKKEFKDAKQKSRVSGPADIDRFYYKKPETASRRSSLSLDKILVSLLMARLGSREKLRKWVSAQAQIARETGWDSEKSVSRKVQENAVRVIADPRLFMKISPQDAAEAEKQALMAESFSQPKVGRMPAQRKRNRI